MLLTLTTSPAQSESTIKNPETAEQKSAKGKILHTEILILASPAKVWQILTDFKNYPLWNPFIKTITGHVAEGNKIKARMEPPDASGMTFHPKVLRYDANKEFRWIGHLFFPGLFDGEHSFLLTDNGDGTTTFVQREQFRGILVPLFQKMLDDNTRRGFEAMNQKLKERAEAL